MSSRFLNTSRVGDFTTSLTLNDWPIIPTPKHPFGEKNLSDAQLGPFLIQLQAMSSCPAARFQEEKTEPLFATTLN